MPRFVKLSLAAVVLVVVLTGASLVAALYVLDDEDYLGIDEVALEEARAVASYGGARGDGLRFGTCHVRFSRIPGMGGIARAMPFYVPTEHKRVVDARELGESQFWDQFTDTAAPGNRKAVAYVHGYNIDFEKGCRRAAMFQRALGLDGTVVPSTWPSDGKPLNYTGDEADLRRSVAQIREFLERLVNRAGAGNVHLVGHSLGARGVVNALVQADWDNEGTPFDQLALLAPDMDAGSFRKDLPKLIPLARRITLYASANDRALGISHQIHDHPRLGEGDAALTLLEGMETVDVSPTGTYEISGHLYHLYNPSTVDDIGQLLRTGEGAAHRPGTQARMRDGLDYWEVSASGSGNAAGGDRFGR